ncbi:MAG: histone deacetylase [Candidatus Aminicenantes bacterium]|nr:histone deacetylase [Candidatus Aminicenantes bacterium]
MKTEQNPLLGRRDFLNFLGCAAISPLFHLSSKQKDLQGSKTALVYSDIYFKHDTGEFHSESPQRLTAIYEGLKKNRLLSSLQVTRPEKAALEWILEVHEKPYMDIVLRDVESGARNLSTQSGNTVICKDSFDVALWSAGGVLTACDAVVSGKVKNAFCAVRPPGHHASSRRGMGYCLFNNVAVAARYLQKKHQLEKVLIMDWDVHHGNGTQDVFYEDDSVFFFSTHQWPWYPWTGSSEETGKGKGLGATLNVPLPAGAGDRELVDALQNKLAPAMARFKPDFVLVSAGFDSRTGDPLGRFRVTDDGYRSLTRILLRIATDHAGGRLVSALEGGYSLEGLSKAVPAHVETLMEV